MPMRVENLLIIVPLAAILTVGACDDGGDQSSSAPADSPSLSSEAPDPTKVQQGQLKESLAAEKPLDQGSDPDNNNLTPSVHGVKE